MAKINTEELIQSLKEMTIITIAQRVASVKNADKIIVDIHAEATSEKEALFYAFAGKVDAIVGSHTHIKTDDAQTYNNTCYITDMGMCGPRISVLGDDPEAVISRFRSGVFEPLPVANSSEYILSGVILDLGITNKIEDFKVIIK